MMSDVREQLSAFISAMWRRRWWGIAVAWLVCLGGWAIVTKMPNRFEAQARVYVDTDSMLQPLLQGLTIRPNVDQQIQIMQRTLLSRPNVEQVLRVTDVALRADTQAQRDALVDRLIANTRFQPQGTRNLFVMSHTDADPQLATRIVQALLNIFVESQLGTKRRDFAEAQSFIDRQIRDYERSLQAAERRLAQFRQQHMDVLPSSGNFAGQAQAVSQRRTQIASDLADAQTRRDNLRRQIADTPQTIPLGTAEGGGSRFGGQIAELQNQMRQLRLRYTDDHPDIIALRRQIQLLQSQNTNERRAIDAQAPRPEGNAARPTRGTTMVPNTVYEQLRLRLADEETNVAALERRLAEAEAEVERLRGLARNVPEIEAELANLDRDYNVIKSNYEALLARREQTRIAQAADERTDAMQFRIIDPPRVPVAPSAPNRPMLYTAVLIIGIGAGFAFAAVLSQFSDAFWTSSQLRDTFAYPVLGSVGMLVTGAQHRGKIIADVAYASILLVLVGTGGAIVMLGPQMPSIVGRIMTTLADRWALLV
ncbi:MAG: chain-length determining protein [Alphaproteobacteria bacterium]|nr:chain-length determining protein [Alphaproteobacteria bacterium]